MGGSDANSGGYEVCWLATTTNPYFAPGDAGVACFPETDTSHTISPAPTVNTYYAVRGINGVGQKSALSNRVGLFRFTLVPGS